mmetsp:Transcript_106850/g.297481  ORF Transcript_106850/g.297481 Transcript_106850/m.297481 type:complete len:489 (+) Transcript_106850:95-1561(+)
MTYRILLAAVLPVAKVCAIFSTGDRIERLQGPPQPADWALQPFGAGPPLDKAQPLPPPPPRGTWPRNATRLRPGNQSSDEVQYLPWRPWRPWFSGTYENPYEHPGWTSRVRHWHPHHQVKRQDTGIRHFFNSAVAFEWMLFALAFTCFVLLHIYLFDWPSSRWYHSMALLIWFGAAALYNLVLWRRLGAKAGRKWLAGYFLEFVFSIENVFIYHIVVQAFQVPRKPAQKALFIVVCCQVLFQMIFFMGLASWLQTVWALPYLLGIWLMYVGCETAREGEHADFDVGESTAFRACHYLLPGRLSPQYRNSNVVFFEDDGRTKVTMLLPAILCLLLVDFVMEVDVTLTKIEEINNHYIGFTSSVAAAFAVPELFFVARDLFMRFYLLKYGVSFVLVFFGAELLLHQFLHIPDMVGILIIGLVLLLCAILSKVFGYSPGTAKADPDGSESELPQAMHSVETEQHGAMKPQPCSEGDVRPPAGPGESEPRLS